MTYQKKDEAIKSSNPQFLSGFKAMDIMHKRRLSTLRTAHLSQNLTSVSPQLATSQFGKVFVEVSLLQRSQFLVKWYTKKMRMNLNGNVSHSISMVAKFEKIALMTSSGGHKATSDKALYRL